MTYSSKHSTISATYCTCPGCRKQKGNFPMKKILAMILVMALCLSLCGCAFLAKTDNGEATTDEKSEGISFGSSKYEKYDALIEAIEANDFEKAYSELVKFADEAAGVSKPTQDEQYAELAKNAVGEWITFHEDAVDVKPLVINEDGTGSYGDESFTWTVDNGSDEHFQLKCLVDGIDFKYTVQFNKYDGDKTWHCQVFVIEVIDEYSWTSHHEDEDTYFDRYNKNKLEIVDITSENFFDYFEMRLENSWSKNEFDEVEGWGRNYYLFLKPEYADRLAIDDSEIKLQYTGKLVYYFCDVDLENQTIEVGEAIASQDKKDVDETTSFRLYNGYSEKFPEEYCVTYFWLYSSDNGWFDGAEHAYVTDYEDFNIERAAGQIILVK